AARGGAPRAVGTQHLLTGEDLVDQRAAQPGDDRGRVAVATGAARVHGVGDPRQLQGALRDVAMLLAPSAVDGPAWSIGRPVGALDVLPEAFLEDPRRGAVELGPGRRRFPAGGAQDVRVPLAGRLPSRRL